MFALGTTTNLSQLLTSALASYQGKIYTRLLLSLAEFSSSRIVDTEQGHNAVHDLEVTSSLITVSSST